MTPDTELKSVIKEVGPGDSIVLTNGCGGLNPQWTPGTPVLISDQINMTGTSPLHGATFIDLTDLYSPRLRVLCREIDSTLAEGVYLQFREILMEHLTHN